MLIAMAEQGKFLEAIQEFYAEDATMQENNQPPRVGLAALLENERRVLASLKEIRVNRADSFIVDGDRSAINWVYLFIDAEGRELRRSEKAYQVWQDGKIIRERFFYAADTAPTQPPHNGTFRETKARECATTCGDVSQVGSIQRNYYSTAVARGNDPFA